MRVGSDDRARFTSKVKLATEVRPGMTTPCLEWQACRDRDGYGQFRIAGKQEKAHRVSWEMMNGSIPKDLCVLHRCDNPHCVLGEHLFLGTQVDNNADRDVKGRQARGDMHYSRTRPELLARGDANGARRHPERLARGDAHGSRTRPERVSRGDTHGARMREVAACGKRNGSYTHPESRRRGEENGNAKLVGADIPVIFQLREKGWTPQRIATQFSVSRAQITRILSRSAWAHVDLESSLMSSRECEQSHDRRES